MAEKRGGAHVVAARPGPIVAFERVRVALEPIVGLRRLFGQLQPVLHSV